MSSQSNNAQILVRFAEIERKVLQLLEKLKQLETENEQLNQKTMRLEKELEEKVEAENQFLEEKALIKDKVDGLLKKIDEFAVPSQ